MKDIHLLVWITQLGLSVVAPLGGFMLLAVWLHRSFGWGSWVIWAGLFLGFWCAIQGFRGSLKAMERMSPKRQDPDPPAVSFNEHE